MLTIQLENEVETSLFQLAKFENLRPEKLIERLIKNYVALRSETATQTEGEKVLQLLEKYELLGCMKGDGNLSEDYKTHLWQDK